MWALCGPCVGPMWALCGPYVGPVRVWHFLGKVEGEREGRKPLEALRFKYVHF